MDIKKLTKLAVVAAVYTVLTVALAPISYGPLQFRVSEVMVLLAFLDPFYIIGLTLGCFIANMLGPNGMMDVVFGTLATFISVVSVSLTAKVVKNKTIGIAIASLWPTIFNGAIIGWMLYYLYKAPLILTIGQVALGEFVVVTLAGIPIFLFIIKRYKSLFI